MQSAVRRGSRYAICTNTDRRHRTAASEHTVLTYIQYKTLLFNTTAPASDSPIPDIRTHTLIPSRSSSCIHVAPRPSPVGHQSSGGCLPSKEGGYASVRLRLCRGMSDLLPFISVILGMTWESQDQSVASMLCAESDEHVSRRRVPSDSEDVCCTYPRRPSTILDCHAPRGCGSKIG